MLQDVARSLKYEVPRVSSATSWELAAKNIGSRKGGRGGREYLGK